jgi:rod shape-determining protein MreD
MALLISIPILAGLAMIQSSIISKVPLLLGTTDLVLVALVAWALQDKVKKSWQWSLIGGGIMTILSGMPFGVYIVAYLGAGLVAAFIRRRVWKVPFLGMLTAIFIGTMLTQIISWLSRWVTGIYIPVDQVFVLIMLPSTLLNMLVAVPAYFMFKDLANRLYPEEIEA